MNPLQVHDSHTFCKPSPLKQLPHNWHSYNQQGTVCLRQAVFLRCLKLQQARFIPSMQPPACFREQLWHEALTGGTERPGREVKHSPQTLLRWIASHYLKQTSTQGWTAEYHNKSAPLDILLWIRQVLQFSPLSSVCFSFPVTQEGPFQSQL